MSSTSSARDRGDPESPQVTWGGGQQQSRRRTRPTRRPHRGRRSRRSRRRNGGIPHDRRHAGSGAADRRTTLLESRSPEGRSSRGRPAGGHAGTRRVHHRPSRGLALTRAGDRGGHRGHRARIPDRAEWTGLQRIGLLLRLLGSARRLPRLPVHARRRSRPGHPRSRRRCPGALLVRRRSRAHTQVRRPRRRLAGRHPAQEHPPPTRRPARRGRGRRLPAGGTGWHVDRHPAGPDGGPRRLRRPDRRGPPHAQPPDRLGVHDVRQQRHHRQGDDRPGLHPTAVRGRPGAVPRRLPPTAGHLGDEGQTRHRLRRRMAHRRRAHHRRHLRPGPGRGRVLRRLGSGGVRHLPDRHRPSAAEQEQELMDGVTVPEQEATDPTASTDQATWQVGPASGSRSGSGPGKPELPTWQQTPRATPPPMGRPAPLKTPAPKTPARLAQLTAPTPAKPNGPGTGGGPSVSTGSPSSLQAPAPRPPRTRGRIGLTLRRWRLPLVAVLPCLTLAGIGWWCWPSQPTPVPPHLVAGTVHAALLTPDEASRLTGMTLTSSSEVSKPSPALAADPSSCAIAVGPTTQAVFGKDWTAFLSATYQDAGGLGNYTMTQVVGVYPDREKAGALLRTLTAGLRSCSSAVRTDQDGRGSKWTYRIDGTASNSVSWTATQDGGNGWACYRQAQLKGKSLLQVGICEAGDGRSTVQALTRRVAAEVRG
ncbi:sensor domain-containing protein [Streptomyces sp. S1A1-7]|nr:sensor domain-containing protein [Streptomyces sp. S1A1-7]